MASLYQIIEPHWLRLAVALLCGLGYSNPATGQRINCPTAYFRLSTHARESRYYVALYLKHQNDERLVCARTDELYDFFRRYHNLHSSSEFENQLSTALIRGVAVKSPLPLDSLRYDSSTPAQLRIVNTIAHSGEQRFIQHFFNEHRCLREEYNSMAAAVIYQLQQWCIWSYQDDETGSLVLEGKAVDVPVR